MYSLVYSYTMAKLRAGVVSYLLPGLRLGVRETAATRFRPKAQ